MMRWYALACVFALGCGGTNPGGGGGDDVQPPMDAPAGNPDAYVPPSGYTKLIGRTWSLQPGQHDIYRCARLTIPTDTYITNIEAQAPVGTHHTVLSIVSQNVAGPDGEYDCTVQTLGMVMLYASGVGTSPLDFPSGVGVKVSAGTQIHLNLHLYNASDDPLSGDSAIWVKSQPTAPPMLAEMVFAGPLQLQVDPGPDTVTGQCTINKAYSLFAIWPHMHKLAVSQKVELLRGSNQPQILHDMPYDFEEQKYWLQSPEIQLQANDKIRVTCGYNNTTGATVNWGDSSDEEMCFAGMYRYPAQGSSLFCAL